MKKYYDNDCNLELLKNKTIAIIGYGSQGHAHAQNLKDSGLNVVVGLNENSKSWDKVKENNLEVMKVEEAAKLGDIVMILVPDEVSADVYENEIRDNLEEGNTLMYAHGFNIHYGFVQPPKNVNVCMVAPKGPGHKVRSSYLENQGVPSLIAVYQDYTKDAKDIALAYASGLGAGRAGILETTFKEETETDLFGEQAVLCGGVTELMKMGFETLVEAGYSPEMAYFECVHEMKLIIDMIIEGGFANMRNSISNTAEYGDYYAGKKIITEDTKESMKELLNDVQDGTFASRFMTEFSSGRKAHFLTKRKNEANHQVEQVGDELRNMMSWLKK